MSQIEKEALNRVKDYINGITTELSYQDCETIRFANGDEYSEAFYALVEEEVFGGRAEADRVLCDNCNNVYVNLGHDDEICPECGCSEYRYAKYFFGRIMNWSQER